MLEGEDERGKVGGGDGVVGVGVVQGPSLLEALDVVTRDQVGALLAWLGLGLRGLGLGVRG